MSEMTRERVHVVILAAGRGSRLGALADSTPKWLLEVGGATIADRHLAAVDGASALVVTGHARERIEAFLGSRGDREVRLVHNPEYARLNNWYSLLVGLRSLRSEEGDRVVVLNADLFADPDWISSFVRESGSTREESLIAVDAERELTDESMK